MEPNNFGDMREISVMIIVIASFLDEDKKKRFNYNERTKNKISRLLIEIVGGFIHSVNNRLN